MPTTHHTNSPIPSIIDTHQPITLTAYQYNSFLNLDIETSKLRNITGRTEEITEQLFKDPTLAPELQNLLQNLHTDEHENPFTSASIKLTSQSRRALQAILGPEITTYLEIPHVNLIRIDWHKKLPRTTKQTPKRDSNSENLARSPRQSVAHFKLTLSHHQTFVTDYDRTLFPDFFNELFDAQKIYITSEADVFEPTYSFFETTQDVFTWELEHPNDVKILPWKEELERQIRTANAAARETGAKTYYQGLISPMAENPQGIEITLEALFLIDPTEHQIQAVQQCIGPLSEKRPPFIMDDLHQILLEQEGYPEFKHVLSQERTIAGVSWAWGDKAFGPESLESTSAAH